VPTAMLTASPCPASRTGWMPSSNSIPGWSTSPTTAPSGLL